MVQLLYFIRNLTVKYKQSVTVKLVCTYNYVATIQNNGTQDSSYVTIQSNHYWN